MAEDMGILSVAYIVSHEIDRKTVGTLWLTVDLHLSIKEFTMADVLKCDRYPNKARVCKRSASNTVSGSITGFQSF